MVSANQSHLLLPEAFLFVEVDEKAEAYLRGHPSDRLIRLARGDVSQPLPPSVIRALHGAVDELADTETFRGYGPAAGYGFLRELIAEHDYRARGLAIESDEIFVSDGAKGDTTAIQEIFAPESVVALMDPAYPVYVESNVMAGRTSACSIASGGAGIVYLPCLAANDFCPALPERRVDLIYLCFPNNPTGAVMTREVLATWVEYARENGSIILFDAAYEAYVREPGIPRSIFEIDGAREVAIEFRSLSKTAGFTGTRCGFTVIPRDVMGRDEGRSLSVNALWRRRQSTRFGGVPYIVQRGAAAVYSSEGRREAQRLVDYYMENARILREGLAAAGLTVHGGRNAPYIWLATPNGTDSWKFFDKLLAEAQVVTTPGVGFGASGEGYVRMTAFASRADTEEVVRRIQRSLIP